MAQSGAPGGPPFFISDQIVVVVHLPSKCILFLCGVYCLMAT